MVKSDLVTQTLRFVVVGFIGFAIDAGLLWVFMALDFNPYVGRLMSFPTALFATWILNHKWTFGATQHAHREGHFRRYAGVQFTGMFINYSIYSLVITMFGTSDLTVFSALISGSCIAMFINFFGARYIAFRV